MKEYLSPKLIIENLILQETIMTSGVEAKDETFGWNRDGDLKL